LSSGLRHAFRHRGGSYLYDAETNALLSVDPVVYALATADEPAFQAASADERRRARREWTDARRDGLLGDGRPRRLQSCRSCHPDGDVPVEHLTLSLTDRCNLRCRYCAYTHGGVSGVRPHGHAVMELEVLERAVRGFLHAAGRVKSPVLSLYGGEPLLAADLLRRALDLVRDEAPRPDVRVVVDTNGLLLEDAGLRALLSERRVDLQVSLDGPAEIHDRHRRTVDDGPSHARILAGLRALLREDPDAAARLRFQITVVDPRDLPAVADWFRGFPPFRELGLETVPSLGVSMADLTGAPHLEPSADDEDLDAAFHAMRRRYVAHRADPHAAPDPVPLAMFDPDIIRWHHRDRRPLGSHVTPAGFCHAGVRRRHLTVDGRWQPCERVGEGHVLGSVAEGFDPAAAAAPERRFAHAMAGRCPSCWAVRFCTVCASHTAGSADGGVPESVCRRVRASREAVLRLFLDLEREGEGALAFLRTTNVA